MKRWRYALIIVVIWFFVVAYIGFGMNDYFSAEIQLNNLHRTTALLAKSQATARQLTDEVAALRKRAATLEQEMEARRILQRRPRAPEYETEVARRHASKELREMWYYLSAEVTKINRKIRDQDTRAHLTQLLGNFSDIHRALANNIDRLNNRGDLMRWRKQEHESLTRLVQHRLYRLQNPVDCDRARKLVCKLNKGCGYGCQVHHLIYCFITAYGANRTLILNSKNWRYSPRKGWRGVYRPVSDTCTTAHGMVQEWSPSTQDNQNVLLPIVDNLSPKPAHLPLAVPSDLADRIKLLHRFPFAWWIGQFTKYLFRYQPDIENEIKERREKLGFRNPIVGVHIRRTDKINLEAAFHQLEEYMYWVELYYKKLSLKEKIDVKRIYLASDDPTVLAEAEKSYPDYNIVSDNDISRSADLHERYSDKSLHGIIFDIEMLSQCDYLVCTFSSQVCRVAYEMKQSRFPDTSEDFQSLDDIYYFGGQSVNDVQAIYPHSARNGHELSLDVGARIQIAGNHWDGYSKGTLRKDGKRGIFPSYLVEKYIHVVNFPNYTEFDTEL